MLIGPSLMVVTPFCVDRPSLMVVTPFCVDRASLMVVTPFCVDRPKFDGGNALFC